MSFCMRAVIPKADSFWTFLAEVACRQPSGLGERVRTERTTPSPHGVAQKKLRPKAGGVVSHVGREGRPTAPEGLRLVSYGSESGRAPREEAAKIAILKSITLETLV